MAIPVDKFVKQLEECGILVGDTLGDFLPPKSEPKDAEELARELVRKKKLTKFQAEEIYRGKGKSLVLGNYVLMEKLGAGGMGEVFKARHRVMNRVVAVKVLPTSMIKDQAAIARFQREVKAAAKLNHPNIVTAHDADQANGVHFLVMELVDGSDLSILVKKNGPLPVDETVNYVLQAAKGLEAAHAEGIVHRDIKPANLLLDKKGTVKVLDMGLARLNGGDGESLTEVDLTSTGAMMGTIDYMAPEQALDTKTADARADIYALGCSLYYLLTGHATYQGDTLMKKLLAHREQPIPSLRSVHADVPEELQIVFKKMVAKRVEDRYQTTTEVIAALETCANLSTAPSLQIQRPVDFSNTAKPTNLMTDVSYPRTITIRSAQLAEQPPQRGRNNAKFVGAGFVGAMVLLSVLVVILKTKHGTLIVEVDQPDATVQVFDADGKVEVSNQRGVGNVTISVEPGKHRLKVEKDGFAVFGKEFEMKAGDKQTLTAKLIPLDANPVMAVTKTAIDSHNQKPLAFQTPGFDQWVNDVSAMAYEKQVDAVAKKLVELNPVFDGQVTYDIENGVVTKFHFVTDNVTDISPVRALVGLYWLTVHGSGEGKGSLSDLSPLQGMPLHMLVCDYSLVADLSPLKGMKLTYLTCSHTKLSDLSPLQGMPLGRLQFGQTKVNDLSPLKGMPLTELECWDTGISDLLPLAAMQLTGLVCYQTMVSDLSPLKGMPLNNLNIDKTMVSDLSPLTGMPLRTLGISGSKVQNLLQIRDLPLSKLNCNKLPISDLSPLHLMPLKQLECYHTKVSDLTPLKGMQLTILWSDVTEISDLSPLQGMPLSTLRCGDTRVSDLSPLKGMPLTDLGFYNTHVSDLSPLQGMPLTKLVCSNTHVSNLSPLKGMELTLLDCWQTPISDLTPLKGMPLTRLSFTPSNITQGIDIVRQIKSIENFGLGWNWSKQLPADEFWKKYDAGEFGKPTPQ